MADVAAVLNILLTANATQANAQLAKTQANLTATQRKAEVTGAAMKKAMLGVGVAAAGAAVALYKIGEEFDDAYDKIRTGTGATGKELKRLEQSFRDVVADVPASFDDASTAVADLNTRLGLAGKPLEKIAKQVTELSRITGTDVKGNVEGISKAFNDWDVGTKKMGKTLDGFYRLSQNSGVAVSDLTTAVQQFGSPLRQLGFSLGEAAATWATFVRAGVNTQTMVPGLKLAIASLTAPTDDLRAKMDQLGIAVGKPDVALRQILDLLGSGSTLSQIEKTTLAMEVFGKRAGADMAEAIKQGRFEVDDMLNTFRNGDDTIRKSGRETMDLSERWQQFTNLLKLKVEPIAAKVFGGLSKLMKQATRAFKRDGFQGILDLLTKKLNEVLPKVAEVGGKIGVALLKGIGDAFIHSSILGKLFIGGTFIRLIGGPGALGKVGAKIGALIWGGAGLGGAGAKGGPVAALSSLSRIGPGALAAYPAVITALVVGLDALQKTDLEQTSDDLAELSGSIKGAGTNGEASGQKIHGLAEQLRGLATQIQDGSIDKAIAQGGGRAGSAINVAAAAAGNAKGVIKDLKNAYGDLNIAARNMSDKQRAAFVDYARALRDAGQISDKQFSRLWDMFTNTRENNRDMWRDVAKVTGEKTADIKRNVGDFTLKVSKDYDGMVTATGNGLELLMSNTGSALKALGLKQELHWSIQRHKTGQTGGGYGNQSRQRGGLVNGAIVPGTGSGDKVPLHLGGRLAAMVEPGELVSVANRNATAALMATNAAVPRFAEGGVAMAGTGVQRHYQGVSGDTDFIPALGNALSAMARATGNSIFVQSGFRTYAEQAGLQGGPNPAAAPGTSHHEYGYAADITPGNETFGGVAGKYGLTFPLLGIGEPWHIELADPNSPAGKAAGVAQKIKRLILKGPNGPLKDMGQAALDKTVKAANAYIAKHQPSLGGGVMPGKGGAIDAGSLPPALQKWNRRFPGAVLQNDPGAWMQLAEMPFNVAAAIAEWAGMPGVTMAQVSKGEGGLKPGSMGDDNGDGQPDGYGWLAITRPYGDSFGVDRYGGYEGMLNPVSNAIVAKGMYDAQGLGAWYGQRFVTDTNAHYTGPLLNRQRGGIVAKLAEGGLLTPATLSAMAKPSTPGAYPLPGGGEITGGPAVDGISESIMSLLGSTARDKGENPNSYDHGVTRIKDYIDSLGLKKGMLDGLKDKAAQIALLGENADSASSLGGSVGVPPKSQIEWLKDQLEAMFEYRWMLIKVETAAKGRAREVAKFVRKLEHEIKRMQKVVDQNKDREKDFQDAVKKAKGKDEKEAAESRLKAFQAMLGGQQAKLGLLKGLVLPGVNRELAGLKGQLDTEGDGAAGLLQTLQGIGATKQKLRFAEPFGAELGLLKGDILSTQITLRDALTGSTDDSNSSALADLLKQQLADSRRENALLRAQMPVFQSMVPYMGAFAAGGVALVGESGPELASLPSGTRITSAAETQAMLEPEVALILNGCTIDTHGQTLAEAVKVAVNGELREIGRVNNRRTPTKV